MMHVTTMYLSNLEARRGRAHAMEAARNVLASVIIGRGFNETLEAFFERDPAQRRRYAAARAFIDERGG